MARKRQRGGGSDSGRPPRRSRSRRRRPSSSMMVAVGTHAALFLILASSSGTRPPTVGVDAFFFLLPSSQPSPSLPQFLSSPPPAQGLIRAAGTATPGGPSSPIDSREVRREAHDLASSSFASSASRRPRHGRRARRGSDRRSGVESAEADEDNNDEVKEPRAALIDDGAKSRHPLETATAVGAEPTTTTAAVRRERLRIVVDRAVKEFVDTIRARTRGRQLMVVVARMWAGALLALCLGWGAVPPLAVATASSSFPTATVISRSAERSPPRRLVVAATKATASSGWRGRAAPATTIMSDEHQRGLDQLKRNLLREGIDPHQDWEGRRQVHFYATGVDLATSPLGPVQWPWGGPTSTTVEPEAAAGVGPFERGQLLWQQYSPRSAMAHKVRHQRQLLSCVVQDLEARGIDPLDYLERNPHHVQRILQLPDADAERLAVLYRRNLNRYGNIMSAKIRIATSVERNLVAPALSRLRKQGDNEGMMTPPPFREYVIRPPHTPSAPDWFDDSDAKVAAEAQQQQEGEADASASTSSKTRSQGHKKSKQKPVRPTAATARDSPSGMITAAAAGTTATSPTSPPTSSRVGTLRKRYLVPALGLVVMGAAALQAAGSSGNDSDADNNSNNNNNESTNGIEPSSTPPSGKELDFQRLYTLLTGDVGSYKDRLQPRSGAAGTDEESPAASPTEPAIVDAPPENGILPAAGVQQPIVDAVSPSVMSLFERWMPHRRYSQDRTLPQNQSSTEDRQTEVTQRSVDSDEESTSTAGDSTLDASAEDSKKARLLSDALAMSRSMSIAELATMEIPASPGAAAAGATQPRDLFDLLSTIEDERRNEFARQLAKLLALGAPAEFFWHVHSLSGGKLPVDITSRGSDSVQRFLLEARAAAGVDSATARQLFDDVKRCMMTDMMEFESKLLQGSTTADAIHHVVDFMAHLSAVHDALVLSCASTAPAVALTNGTAVPATVGVETGPVLPARGDQAWGWNTTSGEGSGAPEREPAPPQERPTPSYATVAPFESSTENRLEAPERRDGVPERVASNSSVTASAAQSPFEDSERERATLPPPPPPPPPSIAPAVRPSYNESYASLRSFLENSHDTYSGTGGLY